MEGESGVTGSIIHEVHCCDVEGDQMQGESGVTRSMIAEIHSSDIQGYQMEGKSMGLLEVSPMNFILGISKKMKWKVKVVLLEVSWIKFIPGISK